MNQNEEHLVIQPQVEFLGKRLIIVEMPLAWRPRD